MSKKTRHTTPKVSICIPTYNQAEFLPQALESALDQTFENIEIVVSVNHCTDNTEDILKKYSDPRIKVVRPSRFLKMAENWHFCVSQSKGEYFNLLSSDDRLLPEYVEHMVEVLDANPGVGFAHCACETIGKDGKILRQTNPLKREFVRSGRVKFKRYVVQSNAALVSAMIGRTVYEKVGGFGRQWEMIGDWDLWLRLLQVGDVAYVPKHLVQYRAWQDDKGVRAGRIKKQLFETITLYQGLEKQLLAEGLCDARLLRFAKRRYALIFLTTVWELKSQPEREELGNTILKLSNDWLVLAKLRMLQAGFGPLWSSSKRIKSRVKELVKQFLKQALRL
ncbi:MAG: glycosyltransferase [Desulforudis sp.]|jgi:glycosyltransferase involved in cell wall biosynthesis|nr:MAG: glycosyltransferase [Desulforudis sp.]